MLLVWRGEACSWVEDDRWGGFFWFVWRTFRGIVLVTQRERLPNRIYGVSL